MALSTDPSKNVFKITQKKIPRQSNILWLHLQSAHKQGNLSFHFHAPGSKRYTHVFKQQRLSQNVSPVCSSFVLVFASDMHFESESVKRAKNVDFHTAKNIQIQLTLFRCF